MEKALCFMLQARMGSTRLPQKMALPFHADRTILEILITRLQRAFPDIPIVLATSRQPENEVLVQLAHNKGCLVFTGSENDVLDRFIQAAHQHQFHNIIRICADNPFLDMAELKRLLVFVVENQEFDYVSFVVNGTPSIKTHYGFWTEFVPLPTLERVKALTQERYYQEHVTNYIYEHAEQFSVFLLEAEPVLAGRKDIRMTLDTLVDFSVLQEIYAKLFTVYGDDFSIREIVSFLDLYPQYKSIMLEQITVNTK